MFAHVCVFVFESVRGCLVGTGLLFTLVATFVFLFSQMMLLLFVLKTPDFNLLEYMTKIMKNVCLIRSTDSCSSLPTFSQCMLLEMMQPSDR